MNKKEALKSIKGGTFFLGDVDEQLKADEEVVFESVKLNGLYLKFADEKLKADKKIVLAAVKQNGMSIYFASKKLKADKEVALEAVKNNSDALEYVDNKLKAILKDTDDKKDKSSSYIIIGQEISIYNQIFDFEDFKTNTKIKKNIKDFIKKAKESSSSMPLLGTLDKKLKKITSEKSQLVDAKNSNINYEIINIGDLYKKPSKGKIILVYYYQYLSSEYDIQFIKETKKVLLNINNFNGLAILSDNNKGIDINNESSDKPTDPYIEVILSSGKRLNYISSEQKKLIEDLGNLTNL